MTTAEIYAPPRDVTGNTVPELVPTLGRAQQLAAGALVAFRTTIESGVAVTPAHRAELLRELAHRSVLADAGLDRHLGEQIDREAWGFTGE